MILLAVVISTAVERAAHQSRIYRCHLGACEVLSVVVLDSRPRPRRSGLNCVHGWDLSLNGVVTMSRRFSKLS